MSNKITIRSRVDHSGKSADGGFSLIETIIAIFILTFGLLGTAAALTYAFEYGTTSRNVGNAKLIVVATMEEIESLRNTRRLEFKQLANVGAVDNSGAKNSFSGFSPDFRPVSLTPGTDGIYGTVDDLKDVGPDGIAGTSDDVENPSLARSGYLRKITITPLPLEPSIKKVEVRVQYYSVGGKVSEISGVGYINDETRTTG
jgi:hypothetical protein